MKKRLHMIGNAHLDPVWMWRWQEGFSENKATLRSALDRISEYDEFIFTASSAKFFEWIENSDPDMFYEIKRRVKEGRIIICGGWYIEPDCNIPSGESFVRQGLYAQNYFKDRFGIIAHTAYNVDSFGHNANLPQIFVKSGMENYVFMRPFANEYAQESPYYMDKTLFWWRSPDGSKVLTYRLPYTYTANMNLPEHIKNCEALFASGSNDLMCFYGVGNHGGGPTKKNIEYIRSLKSEEYEYLFSDPNLFFETVRQDTSEIPEVRGSLLHHASGCYSVNSEIKTMNRKAETALVVSESFCAVAASLGQPYPDNFDEAWKSVLFNQFHDILAGSGIKESYIDARNDEGRAISIADENLNYALTRIANNIDIKYEEGSQQILVFNPHSWQVTAPVEIEGGFHDNNRFNEELALFSEDESTVDFQRIEPKTRMFSRSLKSRHICFNATVPALGYKVYRLKSVKKEDMRTSEFACSATCLENEYLIVRFDEIKGGISSIYDKISKREILKDNACVGTVIADNSDTWSHGIYKYTEEKGYFQPEKIMLVENGKVFSAVQIISKYHDSILKQTFRLYRGKRRIDVKANLYFAEKHSMIKLQIPTVFTSKYIRYEIPFGYYQNKNDGYEFPVQRWTDVTDIKNELGIAVLNNVKTAANYCDGIIGLTVARSPVWAHDITYDLDPNAEYDYMDFGTQDFEYALVIHNEFNESEIVRDAAVFNAKLNINFEPAHFGKLKTSYGFLNVNNDKVIVSALKKALCGSDYILRVYSVADTAQDFILDLPLLKRQIVDKIGGHEIKTYRIPLNSDFPISQTNLIELENY